MANNVTKAGSLMQIEFENHIIATVYERSNKDYLMWGCDNNHPSYLYTLYKRNAYHGNIIRKKADYIYGKGLCYDTSKLTLAEQAVYQNFLSEANPFEDWNSVFRKNTKPFEIFDGVAMQIIYGINGKITEVYNQEFSKFRRSPCGKKVFYCEQWVDKNGCKVASPENHPSYKEYPIFNSNIRTGTQIMYYKTEVMTDQEFGNIYPEPNYIQCCQDIETIIEITNFDYSNLKNGMFAAAILSLFNGDPGEDEKRKIEKMFQRKFGGTGNVGKIMFNFLNKGDEPAQLTSLTQPDLDKMFETVSARAKEKILVGHDIDPDIANILQTGTSIGDNTIFLQKFDRWVKSYVEHRQEIHLDIIRTIAAVNGVDLSYLEVKPKPAANNDLPYDSNFLLNLFGGATLKKHYAKQLGIEIEEDETQVEGGGLVPEQQINEHIKKLSGRDWQHIKRLIKEVGNKKTTREAAAMMIKRAYGMTDDDINILFATPQASFSKFDKLVDMTEYALQLFEAAAIDEDEDEILSEEFVSFKNGTEAFNHEFLVKQKFDDSLQGKILEILKGAPTTSVNQIAKQLGTTPEVVQSYIDKLIVLGLVTAAVGGVLSVSEKGLNTKTPTVETEIYTVYKYVTRPDVPSVETTSRPFCKKMLALSRGGKVWKRETIDDMTNAFGKDPWTYRGGFYTNPDTGETTPYCRHIWKSITKARKKK